MLYKTPTKEQLESYAPIEVWAEAIKQARRSDHKRHRTGCVIFYNSVIYAKGCSHTHNGGLKVRSIHAEMDALSHYHNRSPSAHHYAMIVTLTKANNFASISKPCEDCAKNLTGKVAVVIYAEQNNDASWRIEARPPFDLGPLVATRYS